MNRPPILLNFCTLCGLIVLLALGTWQIERLEWKNQLQSKIDTRLKQTPAPLSDVRRTYRKGGDIEYVPVRAKGRYDNQRALFVYALDNGRAGWHVYTPLVTAQNEAVFVNRGFVPDALNQKPLDYNELNDVVTVVGLARQAPSHTSTFTPTNEPKRGRFYWRDLSNMVAARFAKTTISFDPFFIDAVEEHGVTAPSAKPWPKTGVTRVNLPNRHLEYAITWYGLAIALLGVYAVFMYRRQRGMTS